nr:MAG TPA: peptidase [Caudoviricetes sp.]
MTIKQIQALLTYLGYNPGAVDGADGANTQAAVRRFQQAEGLGVDGIAGKATQAALLAAVAAGRVYVPPDDTSGTGATSGGAGGSWWGEIKYFTRTECRCKCGGKYCNGYPAEMSETTMRMADEIRRRAGVPLNNNSALRCRRWNAEQPGAAANSNHMTGHAIDLAPISGNISVSRLQEIAKEVQQEMIPGRGGLGKYRWGVHIDDGKYSRWSG